jgi:hypothetical protein
VHPRVKNKIHTQICFYVDRIQIQVTDEKYTRTHTRQVQNPRLSQNPNLNCRSLLLEMLTGICAMDTAGPRICTTWWTGPSRTWWTGGGWRAWSTRASRASTRPRPRSRCGASRATQEPALHGGCRRLALGNRADQSAAQGRVVTERATPPPVVAPQLRRPLGRGAVARSSLLTPLTSKHEIAQPSAAVRSP